MTPDFTLLPGLVLRTPLYSFSDRRTAPEMLALNEFRLAIFLASSDFYRALETKQFRYEALSDRERLTLEKYLNRIRFRPTPFGLFSGVSAISWSDEGKIRVDNAGDALLYLLPDHSLSQAAAETKPGAAVHTAYELNPTVYSAGREFRFVKSELTDITRLQFLLESFEANPLTRKLCKWIAKQARTGNEILAFLQAMTACSDSEAAGYLEFLAAAQIIRPANGLNIIGNDYFSRQEAATAKAWNKGIPKKGTVKSMKEHISGLQRIAGHVNQQYPEGQTKNRFYANTVRHAAGGLPPHYQQELSAALAALSKLSPVTEPPMLTQFAKDFTERFEARKIPLMEALDPETGVGYGPFASRNPAQGLLQTVAFAQPEEGQPAFSWSAVHHLLLRKWQALTPHDPVIRIDSQDIADLPAATAPLAPGISILFRITGHGLLVESAGGASAAALIGRFTLFSTTIHEMAQSAARQECAANPHVIFADIGQLSDLHTDNINRRLGIYDYEIPINSCSLLPRDKQVPPSDLLVSVDAGRVVLESSRLKKRVIPRLATAYNFRHNHLALFRFLCDLQYHGVQSQLNLDPETWFPGMEHYPRVQYQETILSPAKWQIKNEAGQENALNLRLRLKLPRHIILSRADQYLGFDLDHAADRKAFDNCISGMSAFSLQEALLPETGASLVSSQNGQPLINQFIAMAVNTQSVYQPQAYTPPVKSRIREFIPGSQWLYYKIYGTPAGADGLLTRRITPILEKLSRFTAFEWFFVRYADPGHHIRLRVRIPESQTGNAMALFKKQFSGLVRDRLIREIQTGTYRRELERYGARLIEPVETFFSASSQIVLEFLSDNPDADYARDRFCLSAYNAILEHLIPLAEQPAFLADRGERFCREFGGDKKLRVSLDTLYRRQRQALFSEETRSRINKGRSGRGHADFDAALRRIAERASGLSPVRRLDLAADLIHMHVNRVYPDQQRRHELVLYYCLYKHRLALKSMAKQKNNKNEDMGPNQSNTAA